MGTRSTIRFYSEWAEKPLVNIYQQYDGYISGVGYELANFLKDKTIINGINSQTMETHANGMGCLAAQFIAHSKTEIGGFYITHWDDAQEYNYEVRLIDGKLNIRVEGFNGTPEELLEYNE